MLIRTLENTIGESINARTQSIGGFRELGPADLVHLSKFTKSKESGTYHFVVGVDCSSSASIAAYLNNLTFFLGETQLWFGKHQMWKVKSGIYCCYNAFSRTDVRVLVQIPGSVEAYTVDEFGDKRRANSEQMWLETYLSGMLRSLLYADNDAFYANCCRKLDPISSNNSARFYDAVKRLFYAGPRVGVKSEIQYPSLCQNFLVDGLFKYAELTGTYDEALEMLQDISQSEPEVKVLVCELLFKKMAEMNAVKEITRSVEVTPRDANLLCLESKFCIKKNRLDLALNCAVAAVNAAPSEYEPWAQLAHVYIKKGDYEQALLTINSCPMFSFRDIDNVMMPEPAKLHYPLPQEGGMEELWTVDLSVDNDVEDPNLARLPAPTLKSTFARAYELLTDIVARIGWDALLKYRSNVFVMEVEYRKDRSDERIIPKSDGPTVAGEGSTPENASESGAAEATNGKAPLADKTKDSDLVTDAPQSLETPALASAQDDHLRNKRLCERWLDNLFMVLYDDLRVYTVWRTEMVHYQSQQLSYEKSALEWELLGLVADRLRHHEEALQAFNRALEIKFSPRVTLKLLDHYAPEDEPVPRNGPAALDCVVKMTAWNHRWYTEFSPKLDSALRKLVQAEGLVKIRSRIDAKYSPEGIVQLMDERLKRIEEYKLDGFDY